MKLAFAAGTDVGKTRDHNEDSYGVDADLNLFMVCDGMGGHAAGEVASAIAVHTVRNTVAENKDLIKAYAQGDDSVQKYDIIQMLEHAVQKACSTIYDKAQSEPEKRGMGTTCSLLLVTGHRGFIAHVGDSRIYLIRQGGVHQLTEDHSLVNELVRKGRLKRGEIEDSPYAKYKNAVTRAIGVYESVEPDTLDFDILPEDSFMLCSDGLSAYLTETNLLETLSLETIDDVPKKFIDIANDGGGHDNITSVVVRVSEAVEEEAEQRAARINLTMEVIQQIPFFRFLSYKERVRLMNIMRMRKYEFGSPIIQEGEVGDALYVILTGSVDLLKQGAYITTLGQGDHFGEMALVDRSPRSATAVAKEDTDILLIERKEFYRIVRKEPALAVKLLWNFLGVLADRLRQTTAALSGARLEAEAVDMSDEVTLWEESSPSIPLPRMSSAETRFQKTAASSSDPTEEHDLAKDTRLGGPPAAHPAAAPAADTPPASPAPESGPPRRFRSEEPTVDLKKRAADGTAQIVGPDGPAPEDAQSIIDTLPGVQTFADMERTADGQSETDAPKDLPGAEAAGAGDDRPEEPTENLRQTIGARPSTVPKPAGTEPQPVPAAAPTAEPQVAKPKRRSEIDPMLADTAPGTLQSPFAAVSGQVGGAAATPPALRETKPETPTAISKPGPGDPEDLLDVTLRDLPPEEIEEIEEIKADEVPNDDARSRAEQPAAKAAAPPAPAAPAPPSAPPVSPKAAAPPAPAAPAPPSAPPVSPKAAAPPTTGADASSASQPQATTTASEDHKAARAEKRTAAARRITQVYGTQRDDAKAEKQKDKDGAEPASPPGPSAEPKDPEPQPPDES